MNSNVVNLYPSPTSGATSATLQTIGSSAANLTNSATFNDRTKYIALDVQDNPVRVRFDGTDPTTSVGHLLQKNQSYTFSVATAKVARFIRDGSSDGKIFASEFTQ
tara:strand:+ start:2904 stop:3221 length:318 start_codon:yes stop_codon:yes gene_type:complete